jgi:hypothetical protein
MIALSVVVRQAPGKVIRSANIPEAASRFVRAIFGSMPRTPRTS